VVTSAVPTFDTPQVMSGTVINFAALAAAGV